MNGHEHQHLAGINPGTVALLKNVAEEAAEKTVRRWLLALGVDPDEPLQAQASMAALREIATEEGRIDLGWLRKTRQRADGAIGKAIAAFITIAVAGAVHSAWAGLRDFIVTPGSAPH
jgi:hypothetical protein